MSTGKDSSSSFAGDTPAPPMRRIRNWLAHRIANFALRHIATPWYRDMIDGSIRYGLRAAAVTTATTDWNSPRVCPDCGGSADLPGGFPCADCDWPEHNLLPAVEDALRDVRPEIWPYSVPIRREAVDRLVLLVKRIGEREGTPSQKKKEKEVPRG